MADVGCYILFSTKLNRFYTGAVQDSLESRLQKHNNHTYGNTRFTAKASDWELKLFIACDHYKQALRIERYIKSMKSSAYIRDLLVNPDRVTLLKEKFL